MKRRWIAEDGTEHENRQAAIAHDAKWKLLSWLTDGPPGLAGETARQVAADIEDGAAELIVLLKPFVPPQRRKRRTKLDAAA